MRSDNEWFLRTIERVTIAYVLMVICAGLLQLCGFALMPSALQIAASLASALGCWYAAEAIRPYYNKVTLAGFNWLRNRAVEWWQIPKPSIRTEIAEALFPTPQSTEVTKVRVWHGPHHGPEIGWEDQLADSEDEAAAIRRAWFDRQKIGEDGFVEAFNRSIPAAVGTTVEALPGTSFSVKDGRPMR